MAIVRLSNLADTDLDGIRDYIHQHHPRAANELLDQILEMLERLAATTTSAKTYARS
jgi:plasmid stabilization system protein ParE